MSPTVSIRSLQGNDLVVAGHHAHGAKFQAFGKMHGADRQMAGGGLDVLVEDLDGNACKLGGRLRSVELGGRTDEDSDFVGEHAGLGPFGEPIGYECGFFGFASEHSDDGRRAVEDRDGVAAVFAVFVDVDNGRAEQPVCLDANLVGGAVVDAERAGSAADVDAEGIPGEGLLEDPLAKVAGEEEGIGSVGAEGDCAWERRSAGRSREEVLRVVQCSWSGVGAHAIVGRMRCSSLTRRMVDGLA